MQKHILSLVSAAFALGLLVSVSVGQASAQTLTTLYSFGGDPDGRYPRSGLISDASGTLYGTTTGGGIGYGAVFALIPPALSGGAWTENVLYSFGSSNGNDGNYPQAGLIADASGALYGTTQIGGANNYGTVFKLTPPAVSGGPWIEAVLYSFGWTDGAYPFGALISDASGALYGTTEIGGTSGWGTAFKLTPPAVPGGNWVETVLHNFPGGADGRFAFSTLLSDASGALYGTTQNGGLNDWGTIFKLTPPVVAGGAWTETLLPFDIDGTAPGYGALVSDASGALYGITAGGGTYDFGVVFKLTPTSSGWNYTSLHDFAGGSDGSSPYGGLLVDASGALYGTTVTGGASNTGILFKLTPPTTTGGNWTETVLHSFNAADGSYIRGPT
jgi:uncharacterized repeat protein (TIGR03803 family)